jgi:hypothetical protein
MAVTLAVLWAYVDVAQGTQRGKERGMRVRRLALLGVVAASLAAAAPAQAINDPRVPGDECSNEHSVAVGDPVGGNPGISGNPNVSPPVSANNPGVSTGAKAVDVSQAFSHCANAPMP